ncbi:MAG: amidohydrolase, partial [Synergistaceae bacterium]|nr:amidohydrolase [Synergistaceae bacterium]
MNDFVIRGCTVVDPKNGINKATSVAIRDGKIAGVGDDVKGRRFASFEGAVLMPGIIDSHVHCSDWIG